MVEFTNEETKKESFLSKIGDMFLSFFKKFGLIISSVFGIFVSLIFIKKIVHHTQLKDQKKKEEIQNNLNTIATKTEEAKQEVSEIKEEVKEEISKTEEKIEDVKNDHDDYVKDQQETAQKAGFKKKNK